MVLSAIVRFRAEDAIRHQAMHDPLTGLANRALFNDRLEHALRRRSRMSGFVGVMIVDLDGFKNINDSLGHLAGDALLIAVADRFSRILRDPDTIARLGGDEFAILIDDLEAADQAGPVAQRMLDALVDPVPLPGPGGGHRCQRGHCHHRRGRTPKPTGSSPTPMPPCTRPSGRAKAAIGYSGLPCMRPPSSA